MIAELHHEIECPRCKSDEVTRSHRTRREKIVLFLTASLPYRCANCRQRFYVRDRRQVTELYALWAILFLVVIGVAAYFLYRDVPAVLAVPTRTHAKQIALAPERGTLPETVVPGESKNPLASLANPGLSERPISVIRFHSHTKFGAKWNEVEGGLKITLVKSGPLRDGGLRKGDMVVAIDGEKATDKGMLKARDDIVSGAVKKATVAVLRGREELLYELQK